MEKQKNQGYCRFVAVCDCLCLTAFTAVFAYLFGIWMGLEMYLFIPSGTYVAVTVLLTILTILLYIGFSAAVVYGIDLLWYERAHERRRYLVYLGLSIALAVMGIIVCILLIVGGIFSVALNLCLGVLCTVIAALNAVGFYLKGKEPIQRSEERGEKEKARKTKDKRSERQEQSKKDVPQGSILGIRGEYAGAVFPIQDGEQIMLGKNPLYCQILFDDAHISRVHLSVRYRGDMKIYEITDYSKNGIFREDGKRFPSQVTCQCRPGTIFTMGHGKEVFQLL